jgi:subtilisin family serine protease
MRRKLSVILAVLAIASMIALPASAQTGAPQAQPGRQAPAGLQPVTDADLDGPFAGSTYVPSKQRMTAVARYIVRLADAPLAQQWLDAQQRGAAYDAAAAQAYTDALLAKQAPVSDAVSALGGKTLANFTKLINGVAVEISGAQVRDLYAIPGVVNVSPLPDYELALDETVPWIGAADVQAMGFDGTGITVAVLDSGIDYTHAHLGGSGLQADTDQALAEASQPADPRLYPTAKVIGGYDYVGSSWPNTAEIPDPNPMDDEAGLPDGHGTHVASIIGGVETDDLGPGVAPGVEFYALKICSSVSTSCSGLALLQGMEWAADPDGNGVFDDRADVINMSLGSNYGQPSDDLSAASELAVELGTVVVASAGNGGNNPYIAGSPSTARTVISVAQTSVPSAVLFKIRRDTPDPVVLMDANLQAWSATPTAAISGPIVYGNGDGTNTLGCNPFTADLTGKVSLIDRGSCSVSIKVSNAAAAGAEMAIMALVAPGPPLDFSYGGGDPSVPGFVVTQASGALLKAAGASVTVDPTDPTLVIPLLDVIANTSSRGPAFDVNYVKPNIGAPGASLSASSGNQSYSIFGGTSGAAPMVSGAVAQLLQKAGGSGSLPPVVVKALLMNNAVTDTWQDVPGGMLNPISRQGAGRVDVAASAMAESVAWVPADNDIALSFGFETVADHAMDSKTVEVINTSAGEKTYGIEAGFRYANDVDAGVDVMLSADTLTVPAGGADTFDVDMHVDPTALKAWPFTSGGTFGTAGGDLLTGAEYDGFVTLSTPARVRVVHASPDAPAVDILVNGAVALSNVPFTAVSDYL